MIRLIRPLAALAVVGATACEVRDDRYGDYLNLSAVATVDGAAVTVSPTRLGAFVLSAGRTVHFVEVGAALGAPIPRPKSSDFLAFDDSQRAVYRISTTKDTSVRYDLPGNFDGLTITDDGAFAVVTRTSLAGGLVNTAEVAFIDLNAAPSDSNPTRRTLPSKGGAVVGVDISPPFGPSDRRLVVFRSRNHLATIALDAVGLDPSAGGDFRSIPLAPDDATGQVLPAETLFNARADGLDAFVRTQAGSDVLHLKFGGDAAGTPKPTLNQLSAGAAPRSIVIVPEAADRPLRLVVLTTGRRLVLIEPDTGLTTEWTLADEATTLVPLEGPTGPEVLAYAPGNSAVQRVALADLPTKKQKAIHTTRVTTGVGRVIPVAGDTWFAVLPETQYGKAAGVTLVEIDGPGLVPLSGAVRTAVVSTDHERLFVETYDGRVTSVEVRSGATVTSSELAEATDFQVIPGSDVMVAVSPYGLGRATFLKQSAVDAPATAYSNFGRIGVLDEVDP